MGDMMSPHIKNESIRPQSFQPYLYPDSLRAASDESLVQSYSKLRRRGAPSSPGPGEFEDPAPSEKSKKQRGSTSRTTSGKGALPALAHLMPGEEITYTPTTHRISKAKKGKKVHQCTFPDCPKIFTRAEHRRRHEANHNAHPAFQCHLEGCKRPFQRADLLARHLERQHQMPSDVASTYGGPSRGSIGDIPSPTSGGIVGTPRSSLQQTQSLPLQGPGTMAGSAFAERQFRETDYRTQSVPPSLHDHLSSQALGTAPHGLYPELLYGPSPSGDSLYSSSDSCYSPLSDYYQAPRPLPPHCTFGPEIVQRPHSAVESSYPSIETSPMSVGPPTPVSATTWHGGFDPAAAGFISEAHCVPSRYYAHTTSPPWISATAAPFQELTPAPKAAWHS